MKRRITNQTHSMFHVLLVLLALLLLATGCEPKKDHASNTDVALEVGFTPSGAPLPSTFGAYKSATNKFDIKAVTLEFYFGGMYSTEIEHELTHGLNYPKFELWFENSKGERYFIKSVAENFVSEKYRCYPSIDEDGYYTAINFNHSEIITIPSEMFSEECGTIWFNAYGENPRDLIPKVQCILSVSLYYKVTDGTVTLSSKPFK